MGLEEGDVTVGGLQYVKAGPFLPDINPDINPGELLLAPEASSFTICVPISPSEIAEARRKYVETRGEYLERDEKSYGRTILKGILGIGIGCALIVGGLKFDSGLVDNAILFTGIVSSSYGGANFVRELELRVRRKSLEEFESKYCPQTEIARSIDDAV